MSISTAETQGLTPGDEGPGGRIRVRRVILVVLAFAFTFFVALPWAAYIFQPGPRGWVTLYDFGAPSRHLFLAERGVCAKVINPDQTCENLKIAARLLGLSNGAEKNDVE